jgi:PEGA domain
MTAGTGLVQRWEIVAQRGGEVSAAREQAPGLELWLLGVPRGTTETEVRGWLHDVAGVALEASRGPRGAQPIPTLLHHALTGLLFSHAEVWERPGQAAPCSVVFTGEDDEIGFGWIGAAQVELSIDGHPVPARWVLVRDSTGREARAFRAPSDRDVTIRLTWYPSPLDPDSALIELEAHWAGGTGETLAERNQRVASEGRAVLAEAAPETVTTPAHEPETASAAPGPAETPAEPETGFEPETDPEPARAPEHPEPALPKGAGDPASAAEEDSGEPEASAPYEPITGHDESALETLPPGRPSTGIARWLQKNFGWLGQGKGDDPSGHATLPVPPVADPSMSSDTITRRLEREAALASERAAGAPPAGDEPVTEDVTGLREPSMPSGDPSAVTPASTSPAEIARSLEDELAASAAALAAALSGDHGDRDASVSVDPPWWRGTDSEEAGESHGIVPDEIPPTPEPRDLTARAVTPPVHEPTRPAPPAGATPPPALIRPAAPPVTPRRERPAADSTAGPITPPRMEVPAKLLLRRPRETAPDDPHEIHSRALGARAETPANPEPLLIERVGTERPVVIPPRVAPTTPESAGPETASSEPRVLPAADPSAWVSRFIKRTESTEPPATVVPPPVAGDESAWLESARRDEWRDLGADTVAETASVAEPAGVESTTPPATPAPVPESVARERDPASVSRAELDEAHETAESADPESAPMRSRIVLAQHPAWPEASELEGGRRLDRRWLWAAGVVAVLFGMGWLLGAVQWPAARPGDTRRGPLAALLQTLGFHGPHYQAALSSRPDGAWIKVDGHDLQQRTPATIELSPGPHVVALSFGQWGETRYPVDGKKGDHVKVDGTLWGALQMVSPDPGSVVAISIDERPRGFAPLKIDSLAPGPHQVRFSGPGMASWSQTVEVKVGETVQVLTRALSSPSTGLLQIRATSHADGETGEAKGAKVFLDGHAHGVTPQSIELPRGPHSVRAEWQGVSSAVQMIDLPGGNQRYATFDFGGGSEPPRFKLDAPAHYSETEPVVVSATVDGLAAGEVREMWLHIRGPEGTWERYPMSRLDSRTAAVGALTFPVGAFDAQGATQWYVSIVSSQGDEFFTEMQDAQLDKTKH